MPDDKPNDQTPPGNDQTDYKAKYLELSAQIANGDYVEKKVYAGLQKTHETTVLAHKADHDARVSAESKASELETTLKTLQGQLTELTATSEKSAADLVTEQSKNKRLVLVMGDFPEFVEEEAKGLLPTASTLEELTTKLTSLREIRGKNRQQTKEDKIAGTSPTPGSKNQQQNPNAQTLFAEARALQREGKFAEYNAKMNEYYEALKKPA